MKRNSDEFLDRFLALIRQEPMPNCPDDISRRVLLRVRSIDGIRSGAPLPFWLEFFQWVQQPKLAAASLALAFALSAGTTVAAANWAQQDVALKADPLGLAVISDPHTLECHHICGGKASRKSISH